MTINEHLIQTLRKDSSLMTNQQLNFFLEVKIIRSKYMYTINNDEFI